MESQLLAGINFFHPAFEQPLFRFCFCSQSNYESSSHNVASLRRCREKSVTSGWHFGLISVTRQGDAVKGNAKVFYGSNSEFSSICANALVLNDSNNRSLCCAQGRRKVKSRTKSLCSPTRLLRTSPSRSLHSPNCDHSTRALWRGASRLSSHSTMVRRSPSTSTTPTAT